MQTQTLATKDPNHASAVQCSIKVNIKRSNATANAINPFKNDGQSIANNCIQDHKTASTKNWKETVDNSLILYKMASYNKQSHYTRAIRQDQEQE